jgi:hypothetical protein
MSSFAFAQADKPADKPADKKEEKAKAPKKATKKAKKDDTKKDEMKKDEEVGPPSLFRFQAPALVGVFSFAHAIPARRRQVQTC